MENDIKKAIYSLSRRVDGLSDQIVNRTNYIGSDINLTIKPQLDRIEALLRMNYNENHGHNYSDKELDEHVADYISEMSGTIADPIEPIDDEDDEM